MLDLCNQLELVMKLGIVELLKESGQNLVFVVHHSRTSQCDNGGVKCCV